MGYRQHTLPVEQSTNASVAAEGERYATMSEETSNRGTSQGSISPTTRLGTTRAVMAGMVALLVLTATTVASAEQTPTESVKSTLEEVIHILNNEALKQPNRSVERRQKIEQVVRRRVSYEDMARLALGMPWIALTDNERREFVSLFAQLLRDKFAGTFDDMANAQVHYLSEQRERSFAEVRTKLVGQKIDTLIDFRLADKLGQWSVYDVVFDDASLVGNYHAQFTSIIRDHSYASLVKKMKEQTLGVKAFEITTAP
jgi:phospholipid transport system substrate-binding protein